MCRVRVIWLFVAVTACAPTAFSGPSRPALDHITIRGKDQLLRLYGSPGQAPAIVSSGDGGWLHLAPQVAETLAAHGWYVVGFDVKAYLESFTSAGSTLEPREEPADYRQLIDLASRGTTDKPVLIGVSEGAGLSVLAATEPQTRGLIAGVLGLGLPDQTELGWRWTDSIIYLTKGVPREPIFRTSAIVGRVAPLPLAAIHSTHDEFVPLPEVRAVMDRACEPKRLWVVEASNHRFSDNQGEFTRCLLDALAWIRSQGPPQR
jgi:fermentation-respiration switch protein FrsA (DUF1100 family)